MTDLELIRKICNRDRSAFDLFFDRYAQIIFNLCVRILKDTGEAEDVMQEIFMQIWKEAERFDAARASVKTWLFTIARSRSLDRYRSRKTVRQRFEENPVEDLSTLIGHEDAEGENVLRHYVLTALNFLTGEQRQVLELSYYQGLTQEEIAEQLGEPLGTIKSRIRAALIKLRSFLSEGNPDV